MNLVKLLATKNQTVDDITQIYYGLNHHCRCGCGGTYVKKTDPEFKEFLDNIQDDDFDIGDYEEIGHEHGYLNIPEGFIEDNMCYCLYFD